MTDDEYKSIVELLGTYRSLDVLKQLIRRYGRAPLKRIVLEQFSAQPAGRARIEADLKCAADDIDAEEMSL